MYMLMYVVNIVIIYYDTVVKVFTMQTTFVKMIFSMYGTLKFYMHQFKEHLLNLYRYYILFGNENNSIDEFFAIHVLNSIPVCVLHIL